ncbi:MAG: molybdopterin-dependent oxidoreductase [Phototrophicaceae bacterium]|jgi:hypothetical protein
MMNNLKTILFVVLVVAVAACSPAQNPTPEASSFYTVVQEATLSAGDAIPLPENEVILTVTGKIGTTNSGDTVEFDINTLESLGQIEYDVLDPFSEEVTVYRGVPMSAFLAALQLPDDATVLSVTALDDYSIEIPIADLVNRPVILALRQNGEYLSIVNRGPSRLIFPYDDFEYDTDVFYNYWIWQIATMEVR